MEYNCNDNPPYNDLEYDVDTLQLHNEEYGPGINDMFLNNLDPTVYNT
jgi:hypothetical protein